MVAKYSERWEISIGTKEHICTGEDVLIVFLSGKLFMELAPSTLKILHVPYKFKNKFPQEDYVIEFFTETPFSKPMVFLFPHSGIFLETIHWKPHDIPDQKNISLKESPFEDLTWKQFILKSGFIKRRKREGSHIMIPRFKAFKDYYLDLVNESESSYLTAIRFKMFDEL
jgi:hypothetical protein